MNIPRITLKETRPAASRFINNNSIPEFSKQSRAVNNGNT
jgi:hypothetical protein